MLEEGIGSVAVCDGPRLVGIFTERDVLRAAGEGSLFGEVAVEDLMTRRPVTVSPEDDIVGAAELMAAKRIRHLPVCEGEFLVGMIGIRDVLRRLVEQAAEQHEGARDTARALLTRAPRNQRLRSRRPAVVSSGRAPVRPGLRRRLLRAPGGGPRGDARRRDPQRSRGARRPGGRRPVPVATRLRLPADDRLVAARRFGCLAAGREHPRRAHSDRAHVRSRVGNERRPHRRASGRRPLRPGDAEHGAPGRRSQLRRFPPGSRAAGTSRNRPRAGRRARRRRRSPDPRRRRARRTLRESPCADHRGCCSASRRSPRSAGRRS